MIEVTIDNCRPPLRKRVSDHRQQYLICAEEILERDVALDDVQPIRMQYLVDGQIGSAEDAGNLSRHSRLPDAERTANDYKLFHGNNISQRPRSSLWIFAGAEGSSRAPPPLAGSLLKLFGFSTCLPAGRAPPCLEQKQT